MREVDPFDLPPVDFAGPGFLAPTDEAIESDRTVPDNLSYVRAGKIEVLMALKRRNAVAHLGDLREPGTSVHMVTNARMDFFDFTPAILSLASPRVAQYWIGSTWILNRTNAVDLLALFDAGKIRDIGLLTGVYFKRREPAVFATIYEGLRARGQRFGARLNHSKFVSMLLDDGTGLTIESSANFTENGNIETHVFTNDAGLFWFHKSWTDELLGPCDESLGSAGPAVERKPTSQKGAGLGVWAASRRDGDRVAVQAWKAAGGGACAEVSVWASWVADLVRQWSAVLPMGTVVVSPPPGASAYAGGVDCAQVLARAVAEVLAVPYLAGAIERTDVKRRHGPWASRHQAAFRWVAPVASMVLVVDDLITSGTTMRLALDSVRAAGLPGFGFAVVGS